LRGRLLARLRCVVDARRRRDAEVGFLPPQHAFGHSRHSLVVQLVDWIEQLQGETTVKITDVIKTS
jgi:hypothetical protein